MASRKGGGMGEAWDDGGTLESYAEMLAPGGRRCVINGVISFLVLFSGFNVHGFALRACVFLSPISL
jgi:hypothetical protein